MLAKASLVPAGAPPASMSDETKGEAVPVATTAPPGGGPVAVDEKTDPGDHDASSTVTPTPGAGGESTTTTTTTTTTPEGKLGEEDGKGGGGGGGTSTETGEDAAQRGAAEGPGTDRSARSANSAHSARSDRSGGSRGSRRRSGKGRSKRKNKHGGGGGDGSNTSRSSGSSSSSGSGSSYTGSSSSSSGTGSGSSYTGSSSSSSSYTGSGSSSGSESGSDSESSYSSYTSSSYTSSSYTTTGSSSSSMPSVSGGAGGAGDDAEPLQKVKRKVTMLGRLSSAFKAKDLDLDQENKAEEEYLKIDLKCATIDDVLKALEVWDTASGRKGCCRTIRVDNRALRLKHQKELKEVQGMLAKADLEWQDAIADKYMVVQRELDELQAKRDKAEARVKEAERLLHWWTFGNFGIARIRKRLMKHQHLTRIDLNNNAITDVGADDLASALLFNRTLESINLSRNHVTGEGAVAMLKASGRNRASRLKRVNLHANDLGQDGVTAVAEVLADQANGPKLEELNLRSNKAGDEGATALAGMLEKNPVLLRLNLATNGIGIEGLEAIAEALITNRTLALIELSANNFYRVLREKKPERRTLVRQLTGTRVVGVIKNYWQEAEQVHGGRGEELVAEPFDWNWKDDPDPNALPPGSPGGGELGSNPGSPKGSPLGSPM